MTKSFAGLLIWILSAVPRVNSTGYEHFYGGSMSYSVIFNNTTGKYEAHIDLITGWKLGKGPCGPSCKKTDVGKDTNSSRITHEASNHDIYYFGNWSTETGPPRALTSEDVNIEIKQNIEEHVMAVSETGEWEQEHMKSKIVLKPNGDKEDVVFEGLSWRDLPLQTPSSTSQLLPGQWHLQSKIDVRIRSDTGQPNASPRAYIKPFYRIKLNSTNHITIPAIDPEGDFVKCKPAYYVEGGVLSVIPLPGLSVSEACIVTINTSLAFNYTDDMWGGIAVTVHDYNKEEIYLNGTRMMANKFALGSTTVQFLVQVVENLYMPEFIPPTKPSNHRFYLYNGATLCFDVYAKGTVNTTINEFNVLGRQGEQFSISNIKNYTPGGNNANYATVSWKPQSNDIGCHIICVEAVDNSGVDSAEDRCFIIEAVEKQFHATSRSLDKPYFVDLPLYNETLRCVIDVTCVFPIYVNSSAKIVTINVEGTLEFSSIGEITQVVHHGFLLYEGDLSLIHNVHGPKNLCLTAKDINGKSSEKICINTEIVPTDPCESAPCLNSAQCTRRVNDTADYECKCINDHQFEGKNCDKKEFHDCNPNPCVHGRCIQKHSGGHICYCKGSRFTGDTCSIEKFPLQDVTVTNQSETSITLTVTVNKNSSFDAYLVVRDDGTAHNFSALSDKTLTVTGLLPGTKYTLFVFVIFENLTSDENISVTGATEPGAVQNIHLVEHLTTEHSITIKWDPPNHGQVDSYLVSEKHSQPNMSDYVVHISVTKPFYTVNEISNTETVNVSIASQYWNLTGVETQWSLHRDCGPPPHLEHGNFTYFADFPQNTGYGSFLNYQCDDKYRLAFKQSFRHCNPNGKWIGPHLACIVIDCGNVPDPEHGKANLNSSGFGGIVTYECEPGFEIHGVDTRTCLDTGSWNGKTPTCRKATLKNCPESEDRHGTVWKTVNSGRTVTMPCDKGFQGTKSRQCQADGTWSLSVYSCTRQEILTIQNKLDVLIRSNASNVYVDEEVSRTLVSISNLTARGNKSEADSPAFEGEIVAVTSVLEKVAKLSVNINITEQQSQDFIDTASNILDPVNAQAYQAIENTSGNKSNTGAQTILQAMETFAGSFAKSVDVSTTPNKTLASKSLFVTVGAIQNVSSGVYFPEESNLDRESTTRLFLPRSAVNGYLLYTGILYKNLTGILPSIILRNGEKFDQQKINSAVISLKLVRASSRLLQPLTISFEHQVENYSNPTCSFWNFMRNAWDTDGCRKISTNTSFTTCSCNHLTNFAILMNPWQPGFSTEEQAAINYITIVLCSVSGVCLLLTVILQLSFWRYLKRQTRNPPVILVNLSVALAISYVIFLTGVDRTEHQNICRAIAVSLQYIYLVVFFLMLAEGIEISLATVFIFSAAEKIKKWLVPLAWVVPIVIVAIAMGITKLEGFGNDKYCWLSIENGLIWSFVGPALTVIVINVVLLFLIIKIMLNSKYIEDKAKTEKFVKLKSSMKCLCVLLPLMGLTWITGILYVNDNFAWTQYVFAISNGLQGVVIFVMHCLFNKPLKDAILRVKKRYQDTTWTQDKQMTNSSNYRLSTLASELSVSLDSVKWIEKEEEIHERM